MKELPMDTRSVLNFVIVLLSICCQTVFVLSDTNGVTYTWKTRPWSSCFSTVRCGEGHRVRKISCQDSSGFAVEDSNCDESGKPSPVELCFRVCDHHKNVLRWQIGEWSPCVPTRRVASCVGTSVPGVARRKVQCILDPQRRTVDTSACENFWDRPENEMACSMDVGTMLECPQDCVTTKRNISCPPHTCPSRNKWNIEYREVTEVVVAPSKGGAPCPNSTVTPVCPNTYPVEGCHDTESDKKRYLLKIGEWSSCQISGIKLSQSGKVTQISLRPIIGISRRNITCITDAGVSASLSLCNVVQVPVLERKCVVPLRCLTSPWSEWRVKREGCITSDGKVYPEVRTRFRKVVQMPVGAGADPCPPLFEERSVFQDLPSCYKYQWLPLEWSECELRVHVHHGEVKVIRPTCGSGLQYRRLACVRASDLSPVLDEGLCREQRPPTLQRCKVTCRRDCQVSQWSRWTPCTFFKEHSVLEYMEDGYVTRERSIVVGPSNGGAPCPHLQEADRCHFVELFAWQYGRWSNCTLPDPQDVCGPGKRTRNKTCVKINGAILGDYLCSRQHVSKTQEDCVVPCPNDCVLSEWSDWSKCSLACHTGVKQGEKFRNKTLLAIAGKNGSCPIPKKRVASTYCNENYCEPFRWSAGAWGKCESVDGGCGLGVQSRQVECTHGREDAMQMGLCDYMKIPETERECRIPCPVDCVTTNFSDWSTCGSSCDTDAVQYKRRLVIQSPQHGGIRCPESLLEERTCTEALETVCLRQRNAGGGPAHKWNTTAWSECVLPAREQKCGMGFQVRNVSCLGQGNREVEAHFCLSPSGQGSTSLPSAVRSCEVACSTRCVLTTWTTWTPCGYSYDAVRTRSREIVGPLSKNEKCRVAFKLFEEEKCPSDDVIDDGQDLHWMSCIMVDTNLTYGGQSCGEGYRYKFAETGSGPGLERDYCWQDCPVDCQLSDWSEWSGCDVPCGLGFRERRRDVLVPANHLGRPCPEGVNKTEIQRDVCHIVCADFHWLAGGWSTCSMGEQKAKCGNGTQYRTVQCLEKKTEQEVVESKCDPLEQPESVSPCTLHCPGECVMSPWTVTLKCQEPCSESNYQEKTRTVLRHPSPTSDPCPDETVSRVPCVFNDTCHNHSLTVGPWGSCVLPEGALCGEGVQRAPLRCERSDGRQVDAVMCEKTHQSLSLKEPTSKPCYVDCPVDCTMSEWSAWNTSECVACGNAMRMRRTRSTLQPPSDGGQPCPSEMQQRMPCPFKPCYHWKHSEWSTCDLESADCGYGVRRRVVECIRYDGLQVDKALCLTLNVTFDVGDWLDPAWLAMAQEDSQEEEICHARCPGACILSEWSRWSHCHKNCRIGQTVGYQTSSREVMVSPPNATESCSRQLLRTRPCWSDDCNFFRWKLKNGSLVCEGRDGITVQGGCASEPPPCDHWCEKLGGSCNATTGLCRCGGAGVSKGPLVPGPTSAPCSSAAGNGPRPPANHSALTPEIRLKYYPDDSQVSFWMYAMISIGTAFVIFVAVTVYLMCRSSLRQRSVSVERQPSIRRRVNTSKHSTNCSNAQGLNNCSHPTSHGHD